MNEYEDITKNKDEYEDETWNKDFERKSSFTQCMKNIKMCKYKCLKIYVVEKMICSTDVQCQKNDSLTSGFQLSKLNIFFFYFRINNSKKKTRKLGNWIK